jgi:CRP/FNR family transcriptional regulator, anaerobic regulatory protein
MRDFHRLMSREITRAQNIMALLGSMHADERVAMFLLDLSSRHRARGLSPRTFILRMTREEIGSYLGLKLETVSRILTRFQVAALISLSNSKQVTICDQDRLAQLLNKEETLNLPKAGKGRSKAAMPPALAYA